MRITEKQAVFIKSGLQAIEADSQVYLFGSRADDQQRGGDIDILWLTPQKIAPRKIRPFRIAFFRQFGWQKLDIANFPFESQDPFKAIALQQGVLL